MIVKKTAVLKRKRDLSLCRFFTVRGKNRLSKIADNNTFFMCHNIITAVNKAAMKIKITDF